MKVAGAAAVVALTGCAAQGPRGPFEGLQVPERRLLVPTRAEVAFHCSQADAEVALDGLPFGTCEDFDGEKKALPVGKGARRVSVRKPGYATWEGWVEADGTRVVLNVTLNPTGGSTP